MFENRYSWLDRTVHNIAFHSIPAQIALADVEDRLYAKQLADCSVERPVFITALPRAGTTLLLELLAQIPEFASHCYRDMPFLLIPALWSRLSAKHQKVEEAQERAHDDGMKVSLDSPEALEEMLWKVFWRKHYKKDRIEPWTERLDEEFTDFFRSHMRKIIHLRRPSDPAGVRYISKNNANIARISLLQRMFSDAVILIPFRDPLQHAVSLQRQHRNFLKLQDEDAFVQTYMSAVGHHDFGHRLLPIDFNGWIDAAQFKDPTEIPFWLEYWVAAYRRLLENRQEGVYFVSYEQLCGDATNVMQRLSEAIAMADPAPLLAKAADMHSPAAREPDTSGVPAPLLDQVRELHAELVAAAL